MLKEENRKLKGPGKPMLNIAPQAAAQGKNNDRELTKLTVENDRLKKQLQDMESKLKNQAS